MMSCRAYYGIYMTKEVSTIFLYPSKNDDGPGINCSLTTVFRAPSTFFRKLSEVNIKMRM